MKHVPLKEIARVTGVSVSTVSRVMTHHPGISEETRRRVLEAARKMRYAPHGAGRSLSTSRSMTVAFLSYRRRVSTRLITASSDQAGVLDVLEPEGYSLLVGGITDQELRRPRDLRILRQRQVDGVILEGPTLPPPFVQELYNTGIPMVHVDGTEGTARIDKVLHDNEGGAAEITRHSIEQHGRRRPAFLSGPSNWISSAERRRGYESVLAAYGLQPYVVELADTTTETGAEAARRIFSAPIEVDAIVAVNDAVAFGFMDEARRHGVSVPDDIAVTGFDDISWAAFSHPSLTTMRTYPEEMGRQAASRLLELIRRAQDAPPAPVTVRVGVSLVQRASCGCTAD
ncbi:MAG: LacI family DNA-binding transcriptional regulator [Spirochaetaceae bacterium]